MFTKALTFAVALFVSNTSSVKLGLSNQSTVMENAHMKADPIQTAKEYTNTWGPELDDIMDMVDIDGDGHITFEELNNTIVAISKLFGYKIDPSDRGEMEFLWSMMDVNKDNTLSPSEVKKVLATAPLTQKINAWAQDKMLKAANKEK